MQTNEGGGQFKRSLGLLDGTMLVAGSMIGSGIFIVSADILRTVGSAGYLLVVWAIAGAMTVIGALSYGELSAMFPNAGGQYVYLREAYSRLVAFLYGWAFFAVIQTGTIAAVGVGFSKFAAYLFPVLSEKNLLFESGSFKLSVAQLVSIGLVVFLTFVNSRGIREGKWIQTSFTLAKIASLAALLVAGALLAAKGEIWNANWANAWAGPPALSADGVQMSIVAAVCVSMVGSLFSADAWNSVTFIAGEIENPQKNVGRSLLIGTTLVCTIYILMNIVYLAVLPGDAIAHAEADRVGVAASTAIFGGVGTIIIAVMIMVSTFGCNNGLILSGARVYYTMARDGLFFKRAGELNGNAVPGWALWLQCLWASVLCLSGKYGDLLDYVIFVVLIFYILTIAGIFILRRDRPDAPRPYRAIGYPVLPALYIVAALVISGYLFVYKSTYTWPGLAIVLAGIPIYFVISRRAGD